MPNINDSFLVVDVNVIISAVLGIWNSSKVFELNAKERKFKLFAPEFLYVEINKHTEKIAKKTKLSQEEVREALNFIMEQIDFISYEEFKDKFKEAKESLKEHEKDIYYLALALKLKCNIFLGDKTFKQLCPSLVKTPKEILEEFNE